MLQGKTKHLFFRHRNVNILFRSKYPDPSNFPSISTISNHRYRAEQHQTQQPRYHQQFSSYPFSSTTTIKNNDEPFYGTPSSPSKSNSSSSHLPTNLSALQKLVIACHSAITVYENPARHDALSALGEVTGHYALSNILEKMKSDETGRMILEEKPLVNNDVLLNYVNSKQLQQHKNDAKDSNNNKQTFGQAYAKFMDSHGFDPDDRFHVRFLEYDKELSYVMLRYRQSHDFWHVLTGLPPSILGELALKWVELIQFGLPVAALSATAGSMRLPSEKREILMEVYYPWACEVGQNSEFLLNVYYEKEFDTDLEELRNRLGVIPAPQIK